MSTKAAAAPHADRSEPPVLATPEAPTRPFLWSVRRELWESRSVTIAPLFVLGVVVFASLLGTIGLPSRIRALAALDAARRHAAVVKPFALAPAPIMLATFLVGLFYALEALHGERRDRSILFWKSMPVSDATTVLAKASIPLALLPLLGFGLGLLAQVVLLLASSAVLLGSGTNAGILWTELHLVRETFVMAYGMVVHTLWFAPVYGWALLVSAWARRLPLLWAALPPLVLLALEKVAFQTAFVGSFLEDRFSGAMARAFIVPAASDRALGAGWQLTPGRFFSSPPLWVGLVFTAACLVLAARLRRQRDPS